MFLTKTMPRRPSQNGRRLAGKSRWFAPASAERQRLLQGFVRKTAGISAGKRPIFAGLTPKAHVAERECIYLLNEILDALCQFVPVLVEL